MYNCDFFPLINKIIFAKIVPRLEFQGGSNNL